MLEAEKSYNRIPVSLGPLNKGSLVTAREAQTSCAPFIYNINPRASITWNGNANKF